MDFRRIARSSVGWALSALLAQPLLARAQQPSTAEPAPTAGTSAAEAQAAALPSGGETVVRAPREAWSHPLEPSDADGLDVAEALANRGAAVKVRRGGQSQDLVVRGLQRDNLAVTVDGGRLFGACPNRMDPVPSHVELGELERVELRRGPFDVSAPGALGGSLWMRTRTLAPGPHADVKLSYGTFGDLRSAASASFGGERIGGAVGGSFRQASPFEAGDGLPVTELYPASSANRYRLEDGLLAYRSGGGWGLVSAVPRAGHRVELRYARSMVRDALYPFLLMDATVDDGDRASAAYRIERFGGLREGEAQVFFSHVRHDMTDERRCSSALAPDACSGALPESFGMRTLATARTLGARLQALAGGGGPEGETLFGADFDERRWDAETTRAMRGMGPVRYDSQASMPDVTTWRAGLFAEHRRPLGERLRLVVGMRVDGALSLAGEDRGDLYRRYHPEADATLRRTDWMPGGNVRLEYRVSDPLKLLVGVGHAERSPDAQERYFALSGMGTKAATVGRPDLAPVGNTELDVGALFSRSAGKLSGQLFFARLGNFIVPSAATGTDGSKAKTFEGVTAVLYGGEVAGELPLPLHLRLQVGALYTRGENRSAGVPLPEIPPLQARGALRFEHGLFLVEVEEAWAARQDRVDPRLQEEATPAWFVTNARLAVRSQGVDHTVGVRNLFDRRYVEHLSYLRDPYASGVRVPEPGRTLGVAVSYTR